MKLCLFNLAVHCAAAVVAHVAWAAVGKLEDPKARAALPEFKIIPAATTDELTPAAEIDAKQFARWTRSQGDAGARRYSALKQITRENVRELDIAWTFRAGDGAANIQCTPITVDGLLYAPTPGRAIVAIDATTGIERWRNRWMRRVRFAHRTRRRGVDSSTGRAVVNTRRAFCLEQEIGFTRSIRKRAHR
jgi:glucose dehydrogenase